MRTIEDDPFSWACMLPEYELQHGQNERARSTRAARPGSLVFARRAFSIWRISSHALKIGGQTSVTKQDMQRRCIDAFVAYRKAMKLARWAYLNEQGAYQLQEAANGFLEASRHLHAVSAALLSGRDNSARR